MTSLMSVRRRSLAVAVTALLVMAASLATTSAVGPGPKFLAKLPPSQASLSLNEKQEDGKASATATPAAGALPPRFQQTKLNTKAGDKAAARAHAKVKAMMTQRTQQTLKQKVTAGADPWWLKDLPWWMPPPPEWGPMPPSMYMAFYHPHHRSMSTPSYAPLYSAADGPNSIAPPTPATGEIGSANAFLQVDATISSAAFLAAHHGVHQQMRAMPEDYWTQKDGPHYKPKPVVPVRFEQRSGPRTVAEHLVNRDVVKVPDHIRYDPRGLFKRYWKHREEWARDGKPFSFVSAPAYPPDPAEIARDPKRGMLRPKVKPSYFSFFPYYASKYDVA